MSEWFIVPEQYHGKGRYPQIDELVLAWQQQKYVLARYNKKGEWWILEAGRSPVPPTHWMPLPEGPDEEDKTSTLNAI